MTAQVFSHATLIANAPPLVPASLSASARFVPYPPAALEASPAE
jgi:hypothetical protein